MAYKRILSSKIKIPENEHEDFPTVPNDTIPFASALCEVIRNSRNIISSPVPSRANRNETSSIRNQIPINTNPITAKIQGSSNFEGKNITFKRPTTPNKYYNNEVLEKTFDSSGEIFSDVSPRYSNNSKINTRFSSGHNAEDYKCHSSSKHSSTMAEMQCIIQTIRNTNKEIFEALNNTNRQVTETMRKINVDVENAMVKIIARNTQKEKAKALAVKNTKTCSTETAPIDPKNLKTQNKKSITKTNKSKTDSSSSKKNKTQKLNDINIGPTPTNANKLENKGAFENHKFQNENLSRNPVTDIELKRPDSFPEIKNKNSLTSLEIEQNLKDKIRKEVKDALTGEIKDSKASYKNEGSTAKTKSPLMFFLPEKDIISAAKKDSSKERTQDRPVHHEDSMRLEPFQENDPKHKKQRNEIKEDKDNAIISSNVERKKSETKHSEKISKKKGKSSKNRIKVTQSIGTEVAFCTCNECLKKLNLRQSLTKRSMNSRQPSCEMEMVVEDEESLSCEFLLAEQFRGSEVTVEHSRESSNLKYGKLIPNSDRKKNVDSTNVFYPVKVKTWFQNRRAKWRRCNSVSSNSSESAKGIYNEDSENELGEVDLSRSASPSRQSTP